MTIYHAVIHTMTEAGTIPHGFLTVENGKITWCPVRRPGHCNRRRLRRKRQSAAAGLY